MVNQAHALLQHPLALSFAREISGAEIGGKGEIGGRIPGLLINAVEDAAQLAADEIEQSLQLLAVFRGADLLGVGG